MLEGNFQHDTRCNLMKIHPALIVLLVLLSFVAGHWYSTKPYIPSAVTDQSSKNNLAGLSSPARYTCPMHPHIHESSQGSCPICGMDLVTIKSATRSDRDEQGIIHISPAVINNFSVKTETIKRGTLYRELLTYGYVSKIDNAEAKSSIAPVAGTLLAVTNKQNGDEVQQGEVLFRIISSQWKQLQQQYLDALDSDDTRLLRETSQQLMAAGFSLADIQQLKQKRNPTDVFALAAEKRGIITDISNNIGQQISTDEVVYSLAPVYPITGYAEVFEGQWRWLEPGQRTSMIIRSVPNIEWSGEVLEVDDILMNRSRTIKTKLGFKLQPGIRLKPGMQANFTIYAAPKHEVLYVSQDAVIRTGATSRVIVNLDDGLFKAIEVKTGMEDGRHIELLDTPDSVIEQGMRVVSSSQFLLDSESQLMTELQRMQQPARSE